MFIRNATIDEIAASLEENLNDVQNFEQIRDQNRRNEVIEQLHIAANILDEVGLESEAQTITAILEKLAEGDFGKVINDPALPHTSEQALKNLEEKGWMFNVEDGEQTKPEKDTQKDSDEDLVEI